MESKVFFIRGYAKSGTNWVGRLLNLHSEICVKGEFHLQPFFKALDEIKNQRWGILKNYPVRLERHYYRMIEGLIVNTCDKAKICGDRTPGMIDQSYIPNRKCIYVSRDGRDVLVSWTFHAFRNGLHKMGKMKNLQHLFNNDVDYFEKNKHELLSIEAYVRNIAKLWNNNLMYSLKKIEEDKKLNEQSLLYHIKYEDLHKNVEACRRGLYKFLGADIAAANALNSITTPGFDRIDNTAFERRGEAGAWKEYFTKDQEQWFFEEAELALEVRNNSASGHG